MSDDNSKKRLGRGLAALMGDLDQPVSSKKTSSETSEGDKETDGIIKQGERTVPIEHAQYEIIAGERRWRSAQKAGLHEVPIVIRDVADKQALELAIIENVQRADLNSVEEALGYQQLIDEYDYSQNELAQVIGKSRSHVANTLRLLKLPKEVQTLVSDGSISAGHARTLVTADNPIELAKKIVEEGLSVRQAEMLAQGELETKSSTAKAGKSSGSEKSADIRALEQRLEDNLGLKIDLRHGDKEKGELRIKYSSLDQLDEVCKRLQNGLLGS